MTEPQDPFAAPPPGSQPAGQPPTPPPGYGAPPPGYGTPPPGYGAPQGYGAPPPGYGAPQSQKTNTLAIVAFVAAFLCGIAGVVMGIIARNQIQQRGEGGGGLATAAIVIGALNMLIGVLFAFA